MRFLSWVVGIWCVATVISVAETNQAFSSAITNSLPRAVLDDTTKLSKGDTVRFQILEDRDEAPKKLVVTDGGEIDIPYLGNIPAVGKTCKELAAEVKTLLEKDFYHTATVQLAIDQLLRRSLGRIQLIGQVSAPGPYEIPLDETYTVSKAILRAGGFAPYANQSKVRVLRTNPTTSKTEKFVVDVEAVWKKGQMEKDFEIKPGDVIAVDAKIVNF
ncbi:MAG: polysaccharide biosynthesis/export family protein [Verrucomicrobiota bacterium]|nr:polysaccharide biosynthesis/export family protein [Verrucomicrobiota bacterium]